MDIVISFILFFIALIASIHQGIHLLFPFLFGLALFSALALRRNFSLRQVFQMIWQGASTALLVLRIFILIGIITAVWRSSGTIPCIVYYSMSLMSPSFFLITAFLISAGVSFLLGTSFGTVGTVGVVLMVLAKSGGIPPHIAAGPIIAGAYFGDRCSPMSSSANLISVLTVTDLHINIRNMLKTGWPPLAAAIILYTILSFFYPLSFQGQQIANEITQYFQIPLITLLPAAFILFAAFFRLDVKWSMGISILIGGILTLWIQHQPLSSLLAWAVSGYHLAGEGIFVSIIGGGGLTSMLTPSLIVLISSAYAGIFEGAGLLTDIKKAVTLLAQRYGLYTSTVLSSLSSAAFSCNQTLAVILTHQLQKDVYTQHKISSYRLAIDLENTVIILSAVVPWNIAGAVPAAALSTDAGFIPYAFYLILIPLTYALTRHQPISES